MAAEWNPSPYPHVNFAFCPPWKGCYRHTQQRGWDSFRMELYQTLSTAELMTFRSCFGRDFCWKEVTKQRDRSCPWSGGAGEGEEDRRKGRGDKRAASSISFPHEGDWNSPQCPLPAEGFLQSSLLHQEGMRKQCQIYV